METKKYWCDPDGGLTSRLIESMGDANEELVTVKFKDGSESEVHPDEVIDVLFNQEGLELKDIIGTPYDWDIYLYHANIGYFQYRGFNLTVNGEQSTFFGEDRIFKHPELILEHKENLVFGDNCWIEIIEDADSNVEYDVFGSFGEAVEFIDELLKEVTTSSQERVPMVMTKEEMIGQLREIANSLEESDKDLLGFLVWDGNDNWGARSLALNECDSGFDLEISLAKGYEVRPIEVGPDEVRYDA